VLVAAVPYVFATALAACFAADDAYEMVVPDLAGGDLVPAGPFDVVLTDGAVPDAVGDAVIELGTSFNDPVVISVGGVSVLAQLDAGRPVEDLVRLVRRCVSESIQSLAQSTGHADQRSPSAAEFRTAGEQDGARPAHPPRVPPSAAPQTATTGFSIRS